MKKTFLLLYLSGLLFMGYSQTEYMEKCLVNKDLPFDIIKTKGGIDDFTITDSDGNTWNLYEQLDQGKTVFLDLFTTG